MPSITAIITVAVALIGVYIAFALLVSWLQEQIAGFVSLRSKTLVLGIEQLISPQHGFTDQLLSTVGEPFTVRSAAGGPANPPLAQVARSPWPLAQALGWAYVRKFFHATVPTSGDLRFPSYIAAHDFVANLLTYVDDKRLVQRAGTVLTTLQALPDDVKNALPSRVTKALSDAAAPAAVTTASGALAAPAQTGATTEAAAVAAAKALTDAKALLDAVRASADAIYAAQTTVPAAVLADLKNLTTTGNIGAPGQPADAQTIAALEAAVAAMPQPLRDIMLARLRDAQGDYTKFVASLEQWYDDYMDRVSGWYKRCATLVTVYLSVLVVVVLNIDSIGLARTLGANAALANSVSLFSTSLLQANQTLVARQVATPAPGASATPSLAPGAAASPAATPVPITITTTIACPTTASPAPSASPGSASSAAPAANTNCTTCPTGFIAAGALCAVDTAPLRALPFGYPDPLYVRTARSIHPGDCDPASQWCSAIGYAGAGGLKVLGWFLSVVALSLGAPFWFDLLAFVVNVRAAGAPPPVSADLRKKQGG